VHDATGNLAMLTLPTARVPTTSVGLDVEVSVATNDSFTIRALGEELTRAVTPDAGMPPGQNVLDVGILHYDFGGATEPGPFDIQIRAVNTSVFDWISNCPEP
jgi:hypothetical protein